jgi:hypothetical protein
MAKGKILPIELVKPDIDPRTSSLVYNPMPYDFTFLFGGEETTLPAQKGMIWPTPKAFHMAKHLAHKICMENAYEFLQENFKKVDDPLYWTKVKSVRVKPELVQEVINAILTPAEDSEAALAMFEKVKATAKKNEQIAKNKPKAQEKADLDQPALKPKKVTKPAKEEPEPEGDEDMLDEEEETPPIADDEDEEEEAIGPKPVRGRGRPKK